MRSLFENFYEFFEIIFLPLGDNEDRTVGAILGNSNNAKKPRLFLSEIAIRDALDAAGYFTFDAGFHEED